MSTAKDQEAILNAAGFGDDVVDENVDPDELKTFCVTFTASVCIAVKATDKDAAIERIRWHEGADICAELEDNEPSIMTIPGVSFTAADAVFEVIES